MNEETRIQSPAEQGGAFFGRYRQVAELGRGAMGVVYRCLDPNFERTVAVKVLHPELLAGDTAGEFRLRFRNEMRAAGRASHPNVVNVYDAGEQDGRPYFVMEFVEGQELTTLLQEEGALDLPRVLALANEILAGLEHIHSLEVVHRDLKPANIFITRGGNAKLADFGVAKLESTELTQVGTLIGSPRYMSPEQCQGLPVDPRSDLFAAGVVLFEMVTGERCFDAGSPNQIMQQILDGSERRIRSAGPALPKQLRGVLLKALARDPNKRFQNAAAFREALAGTALAPVPAKRGSWLLFGGIVALVLIAVVALGVWRWQQHTPPDSAAAPPVQTLKQSLSPAASPAMDNSLKPRTQTQETTMPQSEGDQTPQVQALSLKDKQKVNLLLQVAQAHAMSGRLVTPSGSSAYDAYQLVLKIDPHNPRALDGLKGLQGKVEQHADNLLAQGQNADALDEAKAGLAAFPRSNGLKVLVQQIQSDH